MTAGTHFYQACLQPLATREIYVRRLADVAFWRPYVRQVCWQHHLSANPVLRLGVVGTYPTFIVDGRWVVKFFGQLFDGAQSCQAELEAVRLLAHAPSIAVPALAATGQLFADEAGWRWPYLVYAFIPGVSLGEAYRQVSFDEKLRLAGQLGQLTRQLHGLALPEQGVFASDWGNYRALIESQRQRCAANHYQWGVLPARLIEQVDAFLLPADDLILPGERPHLVHADLTVDHVLGRLQGGRWQTLALIDWGDALSGSLLYELVALHLDLFHIDKRLLRAYLQAYDLPASWQAQWQSVTRRAMSVALLHRFNVLANLPRDCPAVQTAATLDELAEILWGI